MITCVFGSDNNTVIMYKTSNPVFGVLQLYTGHAHNKQIQVIQVHQHFYHVNILVILEHINVLITQTKY